MTTATTTTDKSQCRSCHKTYIGYGVAISWTYINSVGPYCKDCMSKGVAVK